MPTSDSPSTATSMKGLTHYCVILDRSDTAGQARIDLQKAPGDLPDRLRQADFTDWSLATWFEFVVVWGLWTRREGLLVPYVTIEQLLNEGLPKAMEHTLEDGETCWLMVGIAPEALKRLRQKLAKLQAPDGPMVLVPMGGKGNQGEREAGVPAFLH